MGPLLAIEVQVFEIRPAASSEWWTTAVVAVVAALLGAVVGGIATFVANDRMESRRRLARASIRRKAKVYTPIRHELIALTNAIDSGSHLQFGIHTVPPEERFHLNGPRVFLWDEMKRDGRGLSSAAANVRSALDAVDAEIREFNNRRTEMADVLERQGRAHFESVTGAPTTMVEWVHGNTLEALVRSDDFTESLFGYGHPSDSDAVHARAAVVEKCTSDPEVQAALTALNQATTSLHRTANLAIQTLEGAMARIAERYEGEVVRD